MTIFNFQSGTGTPKANPSKSRPRSRRKPRSITGRDEYIVAEALFRYADCYPGVTVNLIDEKAPRNYSE